MKRSDVSEKLVFQILNHPWRMIFLSLLLYSVFVPGLFKIESMFSARIWFAPDHPRIQALNDFEKLFGNDEMVIITVYNPDGIFNPESLKTLNVLTERLWRVPQVQRVESVANYNFISSVDDDISVSPFLSGLKDLNSSDIENLKRLAKKDEALYGYFVSKDMTYALIIGHLVATVDNTPDYRLIVAKSKELIDEVEKPKKMVLDVLGAAAANDAFREVASGDNATIMPIMAAMIALVIMLTFRSWTVLLLPVVLILITVGMAFGLEGWLGLIYNNMTSAVPGVLLAICIADAIHIFMSFYLKLSDFDKPIEAFEYSLIKNFGPTFLTSISTAIGFFSLTNTELIPIRDLGILCGFGTLVAWLFTYTLMGSMFVLVLKKVDFSAAKKRGKILLGKQNSEVYVDWIVRHANKIIIVFIVATIGSTYLAFQNEVNSDPLNYFGDRVRVKKAYDFSKTKIGGARAVELVADSGVNEGVKDPGFLLKVDKYMNWIAEQDYVVKPSSVLNIVKKMNQTLHGGDESFYRVPETRQGISDVLFLYGMSLPEGMGLNNLVSLNNRYLRLRVTWKIEDSMGGIQRSNEFIQKAKEMGLNVNLGGKQPIYFFMNKMVVTTFFKSMGMAVLLVSLLMLLVFKDIKLALLAMMPNLIPLSFGVAMLKVAGQYLDIGTAISSSVCLGIAVDDTIHFIANYKRSRGLGLSAYDAIKSTFSGTGKALAMTTMVLVMGFGSFALGNFVPNRYFGVLCMVMLTMALVTDLLFLPAVLLRAYKK
jgi:hypothetical protein